MRFLSWLRHLPDRLSHSTRRRRARATIERCGVPRSVLFICHGNIYRSPYAAYRFGALIPEPFRSGIEVTSAGFVGPGRRTPDNALECAARAGLDLSSHESSLVSAERVRDATLVVVMEARQKRAIRQRFGLAPDRVLVLGDLDPETIGKRTIQDPWNQSDDILAASYRRIDRCVETLVANVPGFGRGSYGD